MLIIFAPALYLTFKAKNFVRQNWMNIQPVFNSFNKSAETSTKKLKSMEQFTVHTLLIAKKKLIKESMA